MNAKVVAAFRNGLTPILCVGETLDVREAGEHLAHVTAQLDGALAGIPAEQAQTIVVAYEPVWAIGTGKVATPDDAQEVCAAIRERLGASMRRISRRQCASCTAVRSRRATRPRSSAPPTSTARWSAGRAWTGPNSLRFAWPRAIRPTIG